MSVNVLIPEICEGCPKWVEGCTVYEHTPSFYHRSGLCPLNSGREVVTGKEVVKKRAGQQKQKHQDRSYSGKNDRRSKYAQQAA